MEVVRPSVVVLPHTPRLHRILTIPDIQQMHAAWLKKGKQYEPELLRELLERHGVGTTDAQMHRLFLCMNTDRDMLCSWDEFVTHLLHGFRDDATYDHDKPLSLPIEKSPTFTKSEHRYPIVKIRFCPSIKPDRSVDNSTGTYMTCSKEGTLIFWNQNWHFLFSRKSTNPFLSVTRTWITDFLPLPDLSIVCTASIERDLRFYDTTAGNFHPRLIITRFPFAITCVAYHMAETEDADCHIVCGDAGGNLYLFEFVPRRRGPFQMRGGAALLHLHWSELALHGINGMRARLFAGVHQDMVRQVEYSAHLNAIFSAAECRHIELGKRPAPGLCITPLGLGLGGAVMRVPKGVTAFAISADCAVIVTGGPDCLLRLWNHITPLKPRTILTGHRDGVTFVCLQDAVNRIYSVDHARVVKVWDSVEQTLLQTYSEISAALYTERIPYAALYNDNRRALVLAGQQIVEVVCRPLLQLDQTDGFTHTRDVSVCLYDELFRSVITCGFDSMIIVWDMKTGERRQVIRNAHTRTAYGEQQRVEITAGCLDPRGQLLMTGARDGTMKVWNLSAGVCSRNLSIEHMCEVTAIMWLPDRILAVGWNKHVTEFLDTADEGVFGVVGKEWVKLHTDDVACMARCEPFFMATGSYAAELVLWKLQTGQPYRRIDVMTPNVRLKLAYVGAEVRIPQHEPKSRASLAQVPTVYSRTKQMDKQKAERQRKLSIVALPTSTTTLLKTKVGVHDLLFLTTREMNEFRGTLVVALSNGLVQFYTHHPFTNKPFLGSFSAVHMAGDSVTAMATDASNRFLFTGTALGYIKTWLIRNYCLPDEEQVHINMPELRLMFPFMTDDMVMGRAKRSARNMNPMLINSFKAHTLPVTKLVYMDTEEIMLSSSADRSVRMWSIGGRYIGTYGSPLHWQHLAEDTPIPGDYPFRMPPDIQRMASSTTLKVLQGGRIENPTSVVAALEQKAIREIQGFVKPGSKMLTYGKSLPEPTLGKDLKLPKQQEWQPNYKLDYSMANLPIYHHLKYETSSKIKPLMLPRPELIRQCDENERRRKLDHD